MTVFLVVVQLFIKPKLSDRVHSEACHDNAALFKLNYANVMDRAITCQPHIFTLITWG